MSHHCYTAVDELRSATRFARERGSEVAVIWSPQGDEILADVHDESLAGLGLYLDDVTGFEVGREVDLVYAGEFLQGRVRHIEPCDEGYILGLACERVERP